MYIYICKCIWVVFKAESLICFCSCQMLCCYYPWVTVHCDYFAALCDSITVVRKLCAVSTTLSIHVRRIYKTIQTNRKCARNISVLFLVLSAEFVPSMQFIGVIIKRQKRVSTERWTCIDGMVFVEPYMQFISTHLHNVKCLSLSLSVSPFLTHLFFIREKLMRSLIWLA